MKNIENASTYELQKLVRIGLGRTFRLASIGDEKGAEKAKNDTLLIHKELQERQNQEI
jgi:hypothetical protein